MAKSKVKKIKSVYDNIDYPVSGLERINSIPDLNKKLSENFIEKIILKYVLMTQDQIKKEIKDTSLTIAERMIIQQIIEALKSGKNAFHYSKYLQDRLAGAIKERHEISGIGGTPIHIKQEDSIDALLDKMNDKELANFEKAMKVISKVKSKHADTES